MALPWEIKKGDEEWGQFWIVPSPGEQREQETATSVEGEAAREGGIAEAKWGETGPGWGGIAAERQRKMRMTLALATWSSVVTWKGQLCVEVGMNY